MSPQLDGQPYESVCERLYEFEMPHLDLPIRRATSHRGTGIAVAGDDEY